jgi:5-methylcytosine-specific restriction endonuclease McrA
MRVFVLDKNRKPLDPCSPARARELLTKGRAAVFRTYPFTIILKDRTAEQLDVHPHRLKIDPGSKVTGLAILQEATGRVVFAAHLEHRGQAIRARIDARRLIRRSRRQRKSRYRKPRFDNRRRRPGWLPPSLESRLAHILTWVHRLRRFCPITALSQELVRFDLQAMENPEISGLEYQQGTLAGYEVREYLLEKWGRQCAYCGRQGVPLQVEHIQARSTGGTDRVSNLTIACVLCNTRKENQPIAEFLRDQPLVLERIQRHAQAPLKDAAAVNATRWELFRRLEALGLPLECGSGGRTKFNRARLGLPKAHWLDAVCVGASTPDGLDLREVCPVTITARGHGQRQRCRTDRYGFPCRHVAGRRCHLGFQTGDIARASVPAGKYAGRHVGRVQIRFRGSFQVGSVPVHPRHLVKIHRADGYSYSFGKPFQTLACGGAAPPQA